MAISRRSFFKKTAGSLAVIPMLPAMRLEQKVEPRRVAPRERPRETKKEPSRSSRIIFWVDGVDLSDRVTNLSVTHERPMMIDFTRMDSFVGYREYHETAKSADVTIDVDMLFGDSSQFFGIAWPEDECVVVLGNKPDNSVMRTRCLVTESTTSHDNTARVHLRMKCTGQVEQFALDAHDLDEINPKPKRMRNALVFLK